MRAFFFFLAILLFNISICAAQHSIEGIWKLDIDKTIDIMKINVHQKYDSLPNEVKGRAKEAMRNREFIFKGNGEILVNWKAKGQPRHSNGMWKTSNNKIIMDIEGGVYEYDFEMPDDRTLIISDEEQGGYFNILYLTK